MTIVVSILVAEGIVLASDSRQTRAFGSYYHNDFSDRANKILNLSENLGVAILGQSYFYYDANKSPISIYQHLKNNIGIINSSHSFNKIIEALNSSVDSLIKTHISITSEENIEFGLFWAGFNLRSKTGEIYFYHYPNNCSLQRTTADAGIVYAGYTEIINRLLCNKVLNDSSPIISFADEQMGNLAPNTLQLGINFQTMPLLEAIDFAFLLVHSSIEFQKYLVGPLNTTEPLYTCGGEIELSVLTLNEGFRWIRHKQVSDIYNNFPSLDKCHY